MDIQTHCSLFGVCIVHCRKLFMRDGEFSFQPWKGGAVWGECLALVRTHQAVRAPGIATGKPSF